MVKGWVWRAALGCAALLAGCVERMDVQVRDAFSVEQDCPPSQVQLREAWPGHFEAEGCGKLGAYTCTGGGCVLDNRPPHVTSDDVTGPGKLFYSATLEPDGLLKISAWPEEKDEHIELSLATSTQRGCKVDLLLDGVAVELEPPERGIVDLDTDVLLALREASRVALRGCGGSWVLSTEQLNDLHGFAQKYVEKVPDRDKRGKQGAGARGELKHAPKGGWAPWQGLSAFPNAKLEGEALPGTQLFEKLAPSVLKVEVKRAAGYAQGSAVAVTPNLAITNCHVVELAKSIVVKQQSQEFAATLVQSDPNKDRCVLQVKDATLQPVVGVRPYADLKVGEALYTLGAPSGLDLTLTNGILSGRREDEGVRYVQTTAPISPGSSGGGLFDVRGNLVGVTTLSVVGKEHLNQSLNFAIAAEMFWSP
jgi:hypothetical protein